MQTALRKHEQSFGKCYRKPEFHIIRGVVQVQLCLNTGGTKNSLSSHGPLGSSLVGLGGMGIRTPPLQPEQHHFHLLYTHRRYVGGAVCMSYLSGSWLGVILLLRGYLMMSADIFDCHNLWRGSGGDCCWHLVR